MNKHNDRLQWLDRALHACSGPKAARVPVEEPSKELRDRCRAAAFEAVVVLKMQQYRPQAASTPGSLAEHFSSLARLAGVTLDGVFRILGITQVDLPDASSARGLAQLARHLGLPREEAILRLRYGFAQLAGAILPAEWPSAPILVRGRQPHRGLPDRGKFEEALRRCEVDYSSSRRARLRVALSAFAEAYEQATD